MALTRKMLSAMDIPAEKIDEIINAHTETVNALKDEKDKVQKELDDLKEHAGDVESLKKELNDANSELEKVKSGDWENKYKNIKSEYENFKTDTEAKATKAKKESAYKQLLVDAGVSSKRVDSIVKISASNIDAIEFDDDGKIKNADELTESVKTEWSDFIVTEGKKGADVSNPPANDGDGNIRKPSKAAQMVAQYRNEHYGNPNKED